MSDGKSKRDDFVLLIFISLNKQNLIKFKSEGKSLRRACSYSVATFGVNNKTMSN